MTASPLTGLMLITIAGLATACFYTPFRGVRGWAWEKYWLVFGVFSWVVCPWLAAWLTVPHLGNVLSSVPSATLAPTFLFGAMWGVGSLTNGLALRYLGMSLGWAIPLGLCAALGTLIPPTVAGTFHELVESRSGQMTLSRVVLGLVGIMICAIAGALKDRELSAEQKQKSISEFNLGRGLWLSALSGAMSACMAFGIARGKPIAEAALLNGTANLWQNTSLFAVLLLGGFATNCIWCLVLMARKRNVVHVTEVSNSLVLSNTLLCMLAGGLWYLQSLFYGMGETKMGHYRFAGWSVLMVCIIIFSNLWGLAFQEWSGTSRATKRWLITGLVVLAISALMTSYGSYLAGVETR